MFGLQTYQADCWTVRTGGGMTPGQVSYEGSTLVSAKPNKMRYELRERGHGTAAQVAAVAERFVQATKLKTKTATHLAVADQVAYVCDGKTVWRQFAGTCRANTEYVEPENMGTLLEPWEGFYARSASPEAALQRYLMPPVDSMPGTGTSVLEVKATGRKLVEGVACNTVFIRKRVTVVNDTKEYRQTWYIGVQDGLVHRLIERVLPNGRPASTREATVTNIRVNAPIVDAAKTFSYTPPPGVKLYVQEARPPLLAAGTMAPDFTARDKDGQLVTLSSYRGKVVVVDFWASWCGPCIASMSHTQEVISKLQKEGVPVVLLAVDDAEMRTAFLNWVAKHEAEYGALTFIYADPKAKPSISRSYQVSGIPTQYVIDAGGMVRASFVGYGGPTDDLERAVRGAGATGTNATAR